MYNNVLRIFLNECELINVFMMHGKCIRAPLGSEGSFINRRISRLLWNPNHVAYAYFSFLSRQLWVKPKSLITVEWWIKRSDKPHKKTGYTITVHTITIPQHSIGSYANVFKFYILSQLFYCY